MEFDKRYIIRIYMRDSDRHNGKLVHREILDYFREKNAAGATVLHGLAGFSERRFVKGDVCELPKGTSVVTTMTTEHPIIIECIEKKETIEEMLPIIREILGAWGMITLIPVHVLT